MRLLRMLYVLERTFITDADGHSAREYDLVAHRLEAEDATAAILEFLFVNGGTPVGSPNRLPGDKAVATAAFGKRCFVLFAQRSAEATQGGDSPLPEIQHAD